VRRGSSFAGAPRLPLSPGGRSAPPLSPLCRQNSRLARTHARHFTSQRALKFKRAYIQAFNTQEGVLCNQPIGRGGAGNDAAMLAAFDVAAPGGRVKDTRPPEFDRASRGFLKSLIDTAGDRLGAFASHFLTQSCQVLGLFAQHLEFLSDVRCP